MQFVKVTNRTIKLAKKAPLTCLDVGVALPVLHGICLLILQVVLNSLISHGRLVFICASLRFIIQPLCSTNGSPQVRLTPTFLASVGQTRLTHVPYLHGRHRTPQVNVCVKSIVKSACRKHLLASTCFKHLLASACRKHLLKKNAKERCIF